MKDKFRLEFAPRFPQRVTIPLQKHSPAEFGKAVVQGQLALSDYVKVCEVADVPPGAMHPVEVGEVKLMIVNVDGTLYAVNRICSHETADLSTGFLMGSVVTCPLHLSRFDVKTGEVENPPATLPLATYKLKVEGASVYVQV